MLETIEEEAVGDVYKCSEAVEEAEWGINSHEEMKEAAWNG